MATLISCQSWLIKVKSHGNGVQHNYCTRDKWGRTDQQTHKQTWRKIRAILNKKCDILITRYVLLCFSLCLYCTHSSLEGSLLLDGTSSWHYQWQDLSLAWSSIRSHFQQLAFTCTSADNILISTNIPYSWLGWTASPEIDNITVLLCTCRVWVLMSAPSLGWWCHARRWTWCRSSIGSRQYTGKLWAHSSRWMYSSCHHPQIQAHPGCMYSTHLVPDHSEGSV